MKRFLLRWFVFKRMDALWAVICIFLTLLFLLFQLRFDQYFSLWANFSLVASLLGSSIVGSILIVNAWGRFPSMKTMLFVLFIGSLTCLSFYEFHYKFENPTHTRLSRLHKSLLWFYLLAPIAIYVAASASRLFAYFLQTCWKRGSKGRVLFFVSVFLPFFLSIMVANGLLSMDYAHGQAFQSYLHRFSIGLFVFLIGIGIPGWLFAKINNWKSILVGTTLVLVGALNCFKEVAVTMHPEFLRLLIVCWSTVFILVASSIPEVEKKQASEDHKRDSTPAPQNSAFRVSFYGLIPLLLLIFVVQQSFVRDLQVFFESGGNFTRSRVALKLRSKYGDAVNVKPFKYEIDFDHSKIRLPNDVLSELELDFNSRIRVRGLHPGVDVTPVKQTVSYFEFESPPVVTANQCDGIFAGASNLYFDYVKFKEVEGQKFTKTGSFCFDVKKPGDVAKVLRSASSLRQAMDIRIFHASNMNREDIEWLLKTNCPICFYDEIPNFEQRDFPKLKGKRLILSVYGPDSIDKLISSSNTVRNSKVALEVSFVNDDMFSTEQEFYELYFAHRGLLSFPDRTQFPKFPLSKTTSTSDFQRCYFEFESDAKGNVTGLYIPEGNFANYSKLSFADHYPKLKTLSFDGQLIAKSNDRELWKLQSGERTVHLESLANLERLYFSKNQKITDFTFLTGSPIIEHLQFSVDMDANYYSIPQLPNLKSVAIFPDTRNTTLIQSLLRQPSLSKILLYTEKKASSEVVGFLKEIKLKLPNVEAVVLDRDSMEMRLPKALDVHLRKLESELNQ